MTNKIHTFIVSLSILSLPQLACACGNSTENPGKQEVPSTEKTARVESIQQLKAEQTLKAHELRISWINPSHPTLIKTELSYQLQADANSPCRIEQVKVTPNTPSQHILKGLKNGTYEITATAIDNYGKRSESVRTVATPATEDYRRNWAGLADSCTYVLVEQFMNKETGTFWASPHNISQNSRLIYWQQAHALDVVIYAYERIKMSKPELANTYETYFEKWFAHKANNYHHEPNDPTGFYNIFTDDMCWISLTLIHLSEATGKEKYIQMARTIYDDYIRTRARKDEKGTGLPWKSDDPSRNACTNAPGCLVAVKLYKKYTDDLYLRDARTFFQYAENNLLKADGRVEEPPLTYTQGTFGEACRHLYDVTHEKKYQQLAEKVILYAATSDRCLDKGVLRCEGHSMDQSIFKAVYVPYAVNLIQDDDTSSSTKEQLARFIEKNAEALNQNLAKDKYPAMYCNYYWGSEFMDDVASMGAQASGASLIENMARLDLHLHKH